MPGNRHLAGSGLPGTGTQQASPQQVLQDYFANNYWPNKGKNNPTNPQMGAWYGGDPAKSDPWGTYSQGFDLSKWLNQFGYNKLNNFSQPKMGWYGMGGTPNPGNVLSGTPWWQYFTGGF